MTPGAEHIGEPPDHAGSIHTKVSSQPAEMARMKSHGGMHGKGRQQSGSKTTMTPGVEHIREPLDHAASICTETSSLPAKSAHSTREESMNDKGQQWSRLETAMTPGMEHVREPQECEAIVSSQLRSVRAKPIFVAGSGPSKRRGVDTGLI